MPLLKSIFHGASHHAAEGREEVDNTSKMNDVIVVRVCFFLLSLPTKQCNRDVIMRAVCIFKSPARQAPKSFLRSARMDSFSLHQNIITLRITVCAIKHPVPDGKERYKSRELSKNR